MYWIAKLPLLFFVSMTADAMYELPVKKQDAKLPYVTICIFGGISLKASAVGAIMFIMRIKHKIKAVDLIVLIRITTILS